MQFIHSLCKRIAHQGSCGSWGCWTAHRTNLCCQLHHAEQPLSAPQLSMPFGWTPDDLPHPEQKVQA